MRLEALGFGARETYSPTEHARVCICVPLFLVKTIRRTVLKKDEKKPVEVRSRESNSRLAVRTTANMPTELKKFSLVGGFRIENQGVRFLPISYLRKTC